MLYGPEYESGKIGSLTPFESPKPEPLRCDSCNTLTDQLADCYWEPGYRVCPACFVHSDEAGCPTLVRQIVGAPSVAAIQEILKQHNPDTCPACSPLQPSLFPARELRYSVWAFEKPGEVA